MEYPCIIMSMLNSQIVDIKANSRFAAYISADGSAFVMGRDFRPRSEHEISTEEKVKNALTSNDGDIIYGIPKSVNVPQRLTSVAVGKNHMMLLTNNG